MLKKQQKRLRRIFGKSQDYNRVPALVAGFIIGIGILLTYILSNSFQIQDTSKTEQKQLKQSGVITNYISYKSAQYEQILSSAAALFNIQGSENVSREDWARFFSSVQANERYPGILAIGYAQQISGSEKDNFTQGIQNEGFPNFEIFPENNSKTSTVVKYIEPFKDFNKKYFGYDLISDPVQRETMYTARDKGVASMTTPFVPLYYDSKEEPNEASLVTAVYYPVYRASKQQPDTEAKRQKLIHGYVYIYYSVTEMMNGAGSQLLSNQTPYTLEYAVLPDDPEGEVTTNLLYSHLYSPSLEQDVGKQKYVNVIRTVDKEWTLSVYDEIVKPDESLEPILVFILGIILSLLTGATAFWMLSGRFKKIQVRHEEEIQRTKDELLALASHQLRTPATGVRQYLGMLIKGYFGKLSKDQVKHAQKAYVANDRQLEIIDQLLYVAKADAGQLHIEPDDLDMVDLVNQVIESVQDMADSKRIKIAFKSPKKMPMRGDVRYIRMIVENLLSNSIKYSYAKSTVNLKLHKHKKQIVLEVSDKGVGIKYSDIPKLFQKFNRIDNPLSRAEGGSGLGLYLAQKLAHAHGGKIIAKPNPKEGATFTLKLPIKRNKKESVVQLTEKL